MRYGVPMSSDRGWTQVGDGVFQRRYPPLDLSVGVVLGPAGATVVDTGGTLGEAGAILRDVSEAFQLPVVAAINTHAHYDHVFGNQVFAALGIPVYGHHRIPAHFAAHEGPRLAAVLADPLREPDKEWDGVELTPPSVLIRSALEVDLGGRALELIPIDPGHTDTDLAVLIPDCRTWFLGDVIEESGPPMFGSGSYPLAWPAALRSLMREMRAGDTIVPGHGAAVDRDFVDRQEQRLRAVADEIRRRYAPGLASDEVDVPDSLLDQWPERFLRSAFREGFAHLDEGSEA